ncbi:DmsC/YnfH family molybdoenzyme membrane anchor subunit [Sulfitobacter sp. D35]|uniref:dimethyl sulfoxide reductase anchor subunit family protein n=1 Tax=Sulfitobacter sp. D35 TaxID=3083252 RepID=UPI00296FAB5F|nr:DmsC/YnfH family molybdoenzyme membrane anchor subunit [Sulfitobacter sp. D35]MDW4499021.1 DmsC/YnfH family molybdoenzyme membrane anchor subunit [Sulfitobacter sp. D35]
MHPAPSVIAFTTFSGLGFGLLVFLGLGVPPVTSWVAFVFFAIAYVFAVGGLLASTFHLGRPDRALKAFTQWRTSWLSREAWCAVASLVTMALYGAGLVFFDQRLAPLGWLGALLCLATVFTTSMIYTQLATVPRWHTHLTPVSFLAWSLAGGALLAGQITAAILLLLAAGAIQIALWLRGDRALARSGTDITSATGLGGIGAVRAFEPPHTGSNYLTREFVFTVGRRHAKNLRIAAITLAVLLPVFLLVLPVGHVIAALAVLSHVAGVLTARWLFFAQAEHVVGLYYGHR